MLKIIVVKQSERRIAVMDMNTQQIMYVAVSEMVPAYVFPVIRLVTGNSFPCPLRTTQHSDVTLNATQSLGISVPQTIQCRHECNSTDESEEDANKQHRSIGLVEVDAVSDAHSNSESDDEDGSFAEIAPDVNHYAPSGFRVLPPR